MLTRLFSTLLSVVFISGAAAAPAVASAQIRSDLSLVDSSGGECRKRDRLGQCVVWAGNPGRPPSKPEGPGKQRGSKPVKCMYGDTEIKCTDPELGYWSNANQCYIKRANPQPSKDSDLWQGNTTGAIYTCTPPGTGDGGRFAGKAIPLSLWLAEPPADIPTSPEEAAENVAATLGIKAVDINIAPRDPSGLAFVGMPVQLWADRSDQSTGPLDVTRSYDGISVGIRARVDKVVWRMGDGTSVTCRGAAATVGKASPKCGHTYRSTSAGEPGSAYTVTATSHWVINWTASGQSGQIPMELTADETLRVGEIQVLNTR